VALIPVFPIPDLVVFPGLFLPLYIFEEKYKKMTRDLLLMPERDRKFIVTMAHSDGFKGVGALVNLLQANENADGTFNLMCKGDQRVLVTVQPSLEPYLVAPEQLVVLGRHGAAQEAMAAWDATEDFRAYLQTAADPSALEQMFENLPDDPLFQASFICVNLRIPSFDRQLLLEADSLLARLQLARDFMREYPLKGDDFAS
jgi:uncharacterized protein